MKSLGFYYYVIIHLVVTETDCVTLSAKVTPKNTCSMTDYVVELQCNLDSIVLQYWKGSPQNLISTNDKITDMYKGKYAILGKYNISISKVGFNDAGTYGCQGSNPSPQQFKAEVIVLEKSLRITSNPSWSLILEKETICYTCEVRYAGNITPSMRWSHAFDETLINHETDNQLGLARTYIDVTGDPLKNGKTFICTMFFKEPAVWDDFMASNAPNCTMNTTSQPLIVHYKPRKTNITLTSGEIVVSNDTLYTGDVLQCQTDSNPKLVTYKWIAVIRNKAYTLGHSQTVILQQELFGRTHISCTVTNYMGRDSNKEGSDTVVIILNVLEKPTVPYDDAQSKGFNDKVMSAIAIGVTCILLWVNVMAISNIHYLNMRDLPLRNNKEKSTKKGRRYFGDTVPERTQPVCTKKTILQTPVQQVRRNLTIKGLKRVFEDKNSKRRAIF